MFVILDGFENNEMEADNLIRAIPTINTWIKRIIYRWIQNINFDFFLPDWLFVWCLMPFSIVFQL